MGHRWDIQLLRAVAVLSVFAYHSGIPHFQGGSLGVDVFFVISGYLITVTWMRQSERGTTDRAGFLRQRLARTLPAAAVLALAVTVAVAIIARDRWGDMLWHLVASVTATENLLVAGLTWNGWDPSIEALTPFTHLWSMSMEVQFYLVWPLLLAAVFGAPLRSATTARRLLLLLLAVVAALSAYAYVAWGVSSHGMAYFSPVTRVWELAAGAALGLLLPRLTSPTPASRTAQVWAVFGIVAGLAGLTWCFLFGGFALETDSPMWGATVVAATASMLVVGRWLPALPGSAAKVLAPVLAIGTISYGLYLWHLPVLWTVSELGWAKTPMWWIGVVTVSVGAATLSWHVVEKPAIAWARKRGAVPQSTQPAAADAATAGQRELVRV